ncbi:MAG: helix-turn-helix transcriptional regulator [Bacteroidales bacterium]|jgi:transcriptional regulator with XRE-family HTH domain|nr:helix-turn-helix transcriptional regulator [Bacteroidales bacterium]
MKSRLQQFLEVEQLSPARLADVLGIQRSGLSHILSGRNKPGFDFIQKLLTKFPTLSAEWLITGKGKMYKEQVLPIPPSEPKELFEDNEELTSDNEDDISGFEIPQLSENRIINSHPDDSRKKKILKRVLLIYSDNSFEDFTPGKIG